MTAHLPLFHRPIDYVTHSRCGTCSLSINVIQKVRCAYSATCHTCSSYANDADCIDHKERKSTPVCGDCAEDQKYIRAEDEYHRAMLGELLEKVRGFCIQCKHEVRKLDSVWCWDCQPDPIVLMDQETAQLDRMIGFDCAMIAWKYAHSYLWQDVMEAIRGVKDPKYFDHLCHHCNPRGIRGNICGDCYYYTYIKD